MSGGVDFFGILASRDLRISEGVLQRGLYNQPSVSIDAKFVLFRPYMFQCKQCTANKSKYNF
jgi:hypothetical protein